MLSVRLARSRREKNEINGVKLPRYVYLDEGRRIFKSKGAKDETTTIFNKYLELHRTSESLDVQLIPVSVLWGRSPGQEDKSDLPNLRLLNGIQKHLQQFGLDVILLCVFSSGFITLYGS